jgi:hypothetical protein
MTQDQIAYGVTVRALVPFDDIPAGTVATIDQVRSDSGEWRFSVRWQCFRAKGRSPYSLFFTAAQLAHFELVDGGSDRARVTELKASVAEVKEETSPPQLSLPFTEWALYQGTEVITRWRYPDAHAGGE